MSAAKARSIFMAIAILPTCGCSLLKDPGFWAAASNSNQSPQPTAQAPVASAPPAPTAVPHPSLQDTELLLFGGKDHQMFLGCLNCSKFDPGSVWNKFGDHGSRFASDSIWNQFGNFGSKFSDESPWNRFGQTAPAVVDRDGKFYGYFTANTYFPNRTRIQALLSIIDNHESIVEHWDDFVGKMR